MLRKLTSYLHKDDPPPPTPAGLPPSTRPLIPYSSSPYGVAPDILLTRPDDIALPVTLADIDKKLAGLGVSLGTYGILEMDGFDVEFKWMDEREVARNTPIDTAYAAQDRQMVKNRYANILAPTPTRVVLSGDDDYINANFIDGCSKKRYIATQGPLPHTFPDFWRMVWEQDVHVILMLTREIESGVVKCARYWPEMDDGSDSAPQGVAPPVMSDEEYVSFAGLDKPVHSETYGEISVHFLAKRLGDEFCVRLFHVLRNGDEGAPRRVVMLQYTGWPDHGVPASPAGFVTLSRLADRVNRKTPKSPLLTHCSAGVGRTGTFMVIHATLETLKKRGLDKPFSIPDTLFAMREQRPSLVQTKDQYRFCYMSIAEQGKRMIAEEAASPSSRRRKSSSGKKSKSKDGDDGKKSRRSSSRHKSRDGSSRKSSASSRRRRRKSKAEEV